MHPPGQVQGLGGSKPLPTKPGSSAASSICFCRNKLMEAAETLFRKEQDSASPTLARFRDGEEGEPCGFISFLRGLAPWLLAPPLT